MRRMDIDTRDELLKRLNEIGAALPTPVSATFDGVGEPVVEIWSVGLHWGDMHLYKPYYSPNDPGKWWGFYDEAFLRCIADMLRAIKEARGGD